MAFSTVERRDDAILFRFQGASLTMRVVLLGVVLAGIALIAHTVASFSPGERKTYRCDRATGTCVDSGSGSVVATIADIAHVEYQARPWRTMGAPLGVEITERPDARRVLLCQSPSDEGGESRFQVAADLRQFLADPSAPGLEFSCTEGKSLALASLRTIAAGACLLLVALTIGFKRHLRSIGFDRKAQVMRLRYSASLPFRGRHREFPFTEIVKFAVMRAQLRRGGSELRLEVFMNNELRNFPLVIRPDSPDERPPLAARKAELEAFVASSPGAAPSP